MCCSRARLAVPAAGAADLASAPSLLGEAGRGLFLVDALANLWEVLDRLSRGVALLGKTVRAELDLVVRVTV
ncbi:hypothetical protein [Streptomyces sp. NPDC088816]|uniref:hypothetical protein n=1 Tax=Streptomyces sp. NPDC088816 TaxID=3365906 RepID=UPI003803D251